MAKKQEISAPKKGMNSDVHPSQLQPGEYSFALNTSIEAHDGSGFPLLGNEPSNLKCSSFKDGFKVIGIQKDTTNDRTYFFLTNPETLCSEIGYIEGVQNITNEADVEAECDCNISVKLAQPLEDLSESEVVETCEYITLLSDCDCPNDSTPNKCLNFNINNPISSEIKNDRCGVVLYWTDNLNPRRKIEVDNIDQYYKETEISESETDVCGTTEIDTCINCEKLLLQKPYKVMCIDVNGLVNGGALKHGVYVFYAAYTDGNGNEMTRYMAVTGEVSVKDPNKNIYQQSELDAPTNYSIKLTINNLDEDYEFFKLAVKQITSVDVAVSYFDVGTFPITAKEIIYSGGEANLLRGSANQIMADYPTYTKAKSVEQANNILFFTDLETQEEVNLQPVVNFLGQFLRWRTSIAEENLYANGEATAKYRSYLRDEVVPFSMRFFTDGGYVTANFPLIGRAMTDEDCLFIDYLDGTIEEQRAEIDGLVDDFKDDILSPQSGWRKDILSILINSATECTSDNRYCKWQYYNTAEVTLPYTEFFEKFNCDAVDAEIINITTERNCSFIESEVVESEVVEDIILTEFNDGEVYTTLYEYVLAHQEDLEDAGYDFLVLESYNTGGVNEIPCCTPTFQNGCTDPNFERSTVSLIDIDESDVVVDKEYFPCPGDDTPNKKPSICNIFKSSTSGSGSFVNINSCLTTTDVPCDCGTCGCNDYYCYIGGMTETSGGTPTEMPLINDVYDRENSISGGVNCSSAQSIIYNTNTQIPAHINPLFDNEAVLITGKEATIPLDCITPIAEYLSPFCAQPSTIDSFQNKIHANALWFKHTGIDKSITPTLILNVSRMTQKPGVPSILDPTVDCLKYADVIRLSIYSRCSNSSVPIETHCIDVTEGKIICIDLENPLYDDVADVDGEIFIAVDTPYIEVDESEVVSCAECDGNDYLSPTWGCFSLNIDPPTLSQIRITGDLHLRIKKTCIWSASCPTRIINEIKCDPIPYEEGKFAYWESILNYPDNEYLYNSSNLDIPSNFFDVLGNDFVEEFIDVFTDGDENEVYVLNENTDFRCKPIRHFKFPDNAISPITDGDVSLGGINPPFKTNKIFPIGIYLDNEIINKFLDLAVLNDLITQEFRDSISGYEIFKGDVRLNRSIIGKGVIYDMYKYQESPGENIWFSNFPYNDLRENELLLDIFAGDNIQHPYDSEKNIKFTFHSPEFHFDKPNIPFELKVEAYFLGNSRGKFTEVDKHPEMVLLGTSAYRWATALASIEATLNFITDLADQLTGVAQASFAGLVVNWGQAVAWVGFGAWLGARITNLILVDVHQKRFEWLKAFFDNGTPYNFAAYYASEGMYNSIVRADFDTLEGNLLRGIKAKKYLGNGRYSFREDFEQVNINHYNRESAVFLSVSKEEDEGHFALEHNPSYSNYDDSRTTSSAEGVCTKDVGFNTNTSKEIYKNLYVPYVSLKNYLPAQYGDIDAVKWMPTHYCGKLDEDNSCDVIFGGETFLSRFYLKRKFPFFINPMIIGDDALPDLTPFSYTEQRNVGFPVYYVDFNTDMSKNFGRFEMPDIKSYFNLDCYYEPKMYVKPPSKFYLYYYGCPSFIVESRVNLNFRHGQNNREKDFLPNQSNLMDWTQEKNVSIREDNYYFYNNVYSHDNDLYAYRILPFNYEPVEWDCRSDHQDRTIYSLPDGESKSPSDFVDRWSIFRANDYKNFSARYGKVIMLKGIENEVLLGLFENATVLFNVANTIQGSLEEVQLGSGSLFSSRPKEFFNIGTQHHAFASSSTFGHVWVDAKRGGVYLMQPGGSGLEEISRYGKKNFFRNEMPFKIRKQFPNISDDMINNPYKGIGLILFFDKRFERYILIKKDVQLKEEFIGEVTIEGNDFIYEDEVIYPTDSTYFTDVSFVIGYNPNPDVKGWISYYSYVDANYAVEHDQYFQTGVNWKEGKEGVWSHLLTNRSFCVFYGDRYDWKLSVPLKNDPNKKWYEKINYKLYARRYSDTYIFTDLDYNFSEAVVFNHHKEATGRLRLKTAKENNLNQYLNVNYNATGTEILATKEFDIWEFGGLFDNSIKGRPLFTYGQNNADMIINNSAYNYTPTYKDLLRSSGGGSVLFIENQDSRIKFTFEWLVENYSNY